MNSICENVKDRNNLYSLSKEEVVKILASFFKKTHKMNITYNDLIVIPKSLLCKVFNEFKSEAIDVQGALKMLSDYTDNRPLPPYKDLKTNIKLGSHQRQVVDFISHDDNRCIFINFDTGTGKTITAIRSCIEILNLYPEKKAMIVLPSPTLIQYYKNEMKKCGLKDYDNRFTIINYHKVIGKEDFLSACKDQIIVIDEVHNYRNKKTKSANYLHRCTLKAFKVILMSATPFYNKIDDLTVYFAMLLGIDELNKVRVKEYINDKSLIRNLFAYYKNPLDGEDYPEFEIEDVEIPISQKAEYYYGLFSTSDIAEIIEAELLEKRVGRNKIINMGDHKTFMVHANGLRRATNANIFFESDKIAWVLDKLEEDRSLKTVITSFWIAAGTALLERVLDVVGISCKVITGQVLQNERQTIIDEFNNDEFKVLIFSKAGSEGINLKGVRTVILLDRGWNYAIERQAMARAIRFQSHIHLSPNERYVEVYRLFLVSNRYKTIDSIMDDSYIKPKLKEEHKVDELIKSISIIV